MKQKWLLILAVIALVLPARAGYAVTLFDWSLNLNDMLISAPDFYSGPDAGQLPSFVDDSVFDWGTGLGAITIAYNPGAAGDYFIGSFFDHEIDNAVNTYFNEYGSVAGTPAAGQSWEIDEPGWGYGDILTNFQASSLDNSNAIDGSFVDDTSMAMGWNFSLGAGETALIHVYLSDQLPEDIFYLEHIDPDSASSFYFYSDMDIAGGAAPVPEPGTFMLLGVGLAGIAGLGGRKGTLRFL